MANQVYYDRKSAFQPQANLHGEEKQIPNAEQQLEMKSDKQMKHIALYALLAYFIFC